MRRSVLERIDDCLIAAEKVESCYAAKDSSVRRCLRRAVRTGHVVEPAPCVFGRVAYWQELKAAARMRHVMRGLQELHPDWVFAGPSAAVAWGLSVSNRYLDKVWLATTRKAHLASGSRYRSIVVSHSDPVTHAGFRLTPFARTVGDCVRIMDFRSGLAIMDSALRVSEVGRDVLRSEVDRSCGHMAGIQRMRAMSALADQRAESGGESIARATMLELGIELPELQHEFVDPMDEAKGYRVDFAWAVPNSGCYIVGELDGFEKYDNPMMTGGRAVSEVIADEHRRQSHLEMCPEVARVARFSFSDVMSDRDFLALLVGSGVPRSYRLDAQVEAAGGALRCRM